jgi:hypothetical protein
LPELSTSTLEILVDETLAEVELDSAIALANSYFAMQASLSALDGDTLQQLSELGRFEAKTWA